MRNHRAICQFCLEQPPKRNPSFLADRTITVALYWYIVASVVCRRLYGMYFG